VLVTTLTSYEAETGILAVGTSGVDYTHHKKTYLNRRGDREEEKVTEIWKKIISQGHWKYIK